MRGTVSKRIRRAARSSAATAPTQYKVKWYERWTGKFDGKGDKIMDHRGTVTSTGFRRVYQDMKRAYLNDPALTRPPEGGSCSVPGSPRSGAKGRGTTS